MAVVMREASQITYRDQGRGIPAVLLHGSACTGAHWSEVIAHLGSGHRVLAPDLHGHGGSDPWGGDGHFSLVARALPGARHEVVPGAGHMLPMTHPGRVAAELGVQFEPADIAA